LSQRAALRLISKPTKKKSAKRSESSKSVDDPVRMQVLSAMTPDDWVEALTLFLGLDGFVRLLAGDHKGGPRLPDNWRKKLETRAEGQAIRRLQKQYPNKRLRSLRLVHDAGSEVSH
jgi:hypothetical protein